MGKYFGTDGVRGVAGVTLNAKLAYDIGRSAALAFTKNGKAPRVLVGKDTRISGDMLEAALIAGMCEAGASISRAGVVPTPAVAFLTRESGMDAGVVISASHNPFSDNGIKLFDGSGYKLPDDMENEIERLMDKSPSYAPASGAHIGREIPLFGGYAPYVGKVLSACPDGLEGIEIALDCSNGAASAIGPEVFRRLGANVSAYFNEPNGININDGCGSMHIGALKKICAEKGCAGFAFDGDSDRVIAVDEDGCETDGDYIMAICAVDMAEKGVLAKNTVVSTVMSNAGLELALNARGIGLIRAAVGDRYVIECMRKDGYSFGGEASGHTIFHNYSTTGDGILAAVMVCRVMRSKGAKLKELKSCMRKFPQVLVNVRADERIKRYRDNPAVMSLIEDTERALGKNGRVLVRPSGTEPLLRIMVEGPDEAEITAMAEKIAEAAKKTQ